MSTWEDRFKESVLWYLDIDTNFIDLSTVKIVGFYDDGYDPTFTNGEESMAVSVYWFSPKTNRTEMVEIGPEQIVGLINSFTKKEEK